MSAQRQPKKVHAIEIASRTDAGVVRPINEDAIAVDVAAGIAVLTDGMARKRGADVAATLAAQRIVGSLASAAYAERGDALEAAFVAADKAIHEEAERDPSLDGMGTTALAAWFHDERVAVGHVGDSRLYRFRGGRLTRLTVDHSFLQEQLARGTVTDEEARASRSRHLVTRALGTGKDAKPDIAEHETKPGDTYLLCTDGLHEIVSDDEIAAALDVLAPNLGLAADTLVEMAKDRGGPDNISVVVARVVLRDAPSAAIGRGFLARIRAFFGR